MFRESKLGLLIKLNPKTAAQQINEAFRQFGQHDQQSTGRALELVAARLDVSPSSLKRHLKELGRLGIEVKRVAKQEREAAPPISRKKRGSKKKSAA